MKPAMTILLALSLAVCIVVADEAKPDVGVKAELGKLAGTWLGTSAEEAGEKAKRDEANQLTLVIEGDQFTAKFGQIVIMKGTIKIDPAQTPKAIDLVSDGPRLKGQTGPGVYELSGDTLRLCLVDPGKNRPDALSTKTGDGRHLMVYSRKK